VGGIAAHISRSSARNILVIQVDERIAQAIRLRDLHFSTFSPLSCLLTGLTCMLSDGAFSGSGFRGAISVRGSRSGASVAQTGYFSFSLLTD